MTVDSRGWLALRAAAAGVGWVPGQSIGLTVEDEAILRLSDPRGAFIEAEGVVAHLDDYWRLQLPVTVAVATGLEPGVPAVALTTIDRGLAIVPLRRLVGEVGE